ncbi:amino acid ABC transporter substrate-binding protein [Clostridium sporogenes]|uniref:Amino acid ABC transporter substrate-binding protein n=1 Tax=Clostridium sporogenes TaxID=1509 RepID=A0ABD6RRX6_CLOSG|nr:ABC transporter substrate-binding protein [Clostridium sporogenes]OSB18572.1 amino acid ABC transporter substrate-binding protein [Clostridium sporogenes]
MFKKKVLSVLFMMVCILSFTLVGCGQKTSSSNEKDSSYSKVKDNGKLVVGLCAQYPPFESRNDKTSKIEGFDVDLAKELGKEMNLKVEIKDAEWEALLGGVGKGDYDVLITCMSKKEAAQANINTSDTYYKLDDIIVVNKNNNSIHNKDDLKGKVVGVQTSTSSEQVVDKLDEIKEIKRYNRNPEAFIDLKNNRIDAVVVGYAYATTAMKDKKDDNLKIINSPVGSSDIVMVTKKGSNDLTKELNKALKKVKESGKYEEIKNKWLSLEK